MNLLIILLISIIIVLIAILLLGVKIFFSKSGKFPNIHVGGNRRLKEEGISCATTQDSEAQSSRFTDITKIIKEINEK